MQSFTTFQTASKWQQMIPLSVQLISVANTNIDIVELERCIHGFDALKAT